MAFRLPRVDGDAPVLIERRSGSLEFTPACSSEVVAEHQLALQRYIFEWTARHEQLLVMNMHAQVDVEDGFSCVAEMAVLSPRPAPRNEVPAVVPRHEKVSLLDNSSLWTSAGESTHDLDGDVHPLHPAQQGGTPDIAPLLPSTLPVAESWKPNPNSYVRKSRSRSKSSNTELGIGTLESKLPEDGHGTEMPLALMKRDLGGDLMICQSSLKEFYHTGPIPKVSSKILLMCEFLDKSAAFQRFCSLVILVNAFCLFFTIEFAIRQPSDDNFELFQNLERSFCVFYVTELFVRLGAQRRQFLFGEEVGWNLFDVTLAVSAIQEQVIAVVGVPDTGEGESSGQNLSYLRILRLLKIVKLLRVIRLMRAFRELRLVLNSVLGSIRVLLWSFLLIAAICFMFGVCFVQGVTELTMAEGFSSCAQLYSAHGRVEADGEGTEAQMACVHWGSVGASMLSLFQASTGGYDWEVLATSLLNAGGLYYGIFCFYIGFFLFVVMNSLTSLFVDSVISNAVCDDDVIVQDQLNRKQEYMAKVVQIFSSIDEDGSGLITYEEFSNHKRDPILVAFANSLDIEPDALEQFFGLLSGDGKRSVDLETFVVGCIRVRGTAKSMDLMDVLITQQRVAEDQAHFMDYCGGQFDAIHQALLQGRALLPASTSQ